MQKGIRQDQIMELTEEQKKEIQRPKYEFKKMDFLEILTKIKDQDFDGDDQRHIVANLSQGLCDLADGTLPELCALMSGILYQMWNCGGGIGWCDVKRIYAEVYECQPSVEEMLLEGWGSDPLIDELIVSTNPSYIGSF